MKESEDHPEERLGDDFTLRVDSRDALEAAGVGHGGLREFTRVRIEVEGWSAPYEGWTGRAGYVADLRGLRIEVGSSSAMLEFRVGSPARLVDVVRAAHSFLYPEVQGTAPATVRAGFVGDVSREVRAWGSVPVSSLEVEPEGTNLAANDVVVGMGRDDLESLQALDGSGAGRMVVADPGHLWVDPGGQPVARIDLVAHNPIGRVEHVGPTADARFDAEAMRLRGPGGRQVSVPWSHSVTGATQEALQHFGGIDLAGARPPEGLTLEIGQRLAEVAATGVVLHDARHLTAEVGLAGEVLALFRAPREEDTPADRAFRSVRQRRTVMRLHGVDPLPSPGGLTARNGRTPSVSVVMSTLRPDRIEQVMAQIARQSYPARELVVACHGVEVPQVRPRSDLDVHLVSVEAGASFGEALAAATARASGELVTKIDDDDHYGPDHLWDLVLARFYSQATLVGKQHEFIYLDALDVTIRRPRSSEVYLPYVAGGTMMISRADLGAVGGWRPVARSVDRGLLLEVSRAGGLVYATAPHGYVYVRHAEGHTWVRPDSHFLKGASDHWSGLYPPALGVPTSRPGAY